MHRIDAPNNVGGMFVDTVPGTAVDADWANAVQEEIVNVITNPAGGDEALVKGNNTQLLAAILNIVAGNLPRSLTNDGYYTFPGGFVLQWVHLTANGNASTNFLWPTEFDTACFGAWCNGGWNDLDAQDNNPFVSVKSVTGGTVFSATGVNTATVVFGIGH
jgi:hypothetical protein